MKMKSLSSRKLLIGATSVALLGGAGGALAATQGSAGSGRQAYVDDVAKRLNVAPSALTAAVRAARSDQIEAAVAAGRITRAQADALKQRAQQGGGALFFGHRFGGGRFGGHRVAAQYLGISAAALRSDLRSGKSLAQIASATPGRSVAGLKAAIETAVKARLTKAASGGLLTSEQAQERLGRLSNRIDSLLQRTWVGSPHSGFGPLGGR
jgi:hypothetical protein